MIQLVSDLETPAIAIADGVLLAPVVGNLDARRAQALNKRLLETVAHRRTRLVILDIAGVTHVDTSVAQSMVQVAQGLRLIRMSGRYQRDYASSRHHTCIPERDAS